MDASNRATRKRYARCPFDWYVEPAWTVEALFDHVPMLGSVGDPACGRGTIPDVARARGHMVAASDIVDRGYEGLTAVADFLTDTSPMQGIDNIVCNPPYSYRKDIAEAFARRALEIARNTVAIIVPVAWLSTETRFTFFTEHPPSQVLVFHERPSMPPGGQIDALGKMAFRGGAIDYCWVVWDRGRNGADHPTELHRIPPRPKDRRR